MDDICNVPIINKTTENQKWKQSNSGSNLFGSLDSDDEHTLNAWPEEEESGGDRTFQVAWLEAVTQAPVQAAQQEAGAQEQASQQAAQSEAG